MKKQITFIDKRICQLEAVARIASENNDHAGWLYFAARRNAYAYVSYPAWLFAIVLFDKP